MISSKNIRLRAPERKDIPLWVSWLNDPEVTAGLCMAYPLGSEEETAWFEEVLKRPAEEHPLMIEIKVGDLWVTVGTCGFDKVDWRSRSGEVGIFIGEKRYWNLGVGTEAMRLLLFYGFGTLNLNRISLRVFANNPRAIHVYEKIGFAQEGCLRQAEYKNGAYLDVICMAILRSEWTSPEMD